MAVVSGAIGFVRFVADEQAGNPGFYFAAVVAFVGSFVAGLIAGNRSWTWGAITTGGLLLGLVVAGFGDPEDAGLWLGTAVVFALPLFLIASALAAVGAWLTKSLPGDREGRTTSRAP